ncbi:unnamed protein product [Prorocentrum cordatum]|uniref:Uncharacterized protein n=1 Tax=Prorocentrum cordatum TaxID=2364126 RepID=A0ABN9V016_9DINO|nr:unnamed protein product [Polarella glacialis]
MGFHHTICIAQRSHYAPHSLRQMPCESALQDDKRVVHTHMCMCIQLLAANSTRGLLSQGRQLSATRSPSPDRGVGFGTERGPAGMNTEPLLGAGRCQLPADGAGCCVAWGSSWYRSWATTLTNEYLCSPISRRALWKYYGIVVTLFLILDIFYGLSNTSLSGHWWWRGLVSFYLSEYTLALLLLRLPVTTLKSDAVVLTFSTLQLYWCALSLRKDLVNTYLLGNTFAVGLTYKVFLSHAAGFHSLLVIVHAIFCSMLAYVLLSSSIEPDAFCQIGMITIVMTLFELLLASYFRELKGQLVAMQTLLDAATDGYCTVRRQVGTISHVSDSHQLLFGADLRGMQILDAVGSEDHWKVARLYDGSHWGAAEPVLATFIQALGEGCQALEFDARLVPYRVTGADIHISFQRVGEVRMAKKGPRRGGRGPRGAGPLWRRRARLRAPALGGPGCRPPALSLATLQDGVRAQLVAVDEGERSPLQDGAPGSGASQGAAETIEELHIAFDSGHPSYLISDGECSRHLLPRQGQLARWFPRSARAQVEKWITDAVNSSVEPGVCSTYLEHFELVIPPSPAIKVVAKRAFIIAGDPEENDAGALSLPATLFLQNVVISRRHRYTTRARTDYMQDLSTIAEDLHSEVEDSLSMNSSEGVSPSDSASVVMM